jgi:hypothetical protein
MLQSQKRGISKKERQCNKEEIEKRSNWVKSKRRRAKGGIWNSSYALNSGVAITFFLDRALFVNIRDPFQCEIWSDEMSDFHHFLWLVDLLESFVMAVRIGKPVKLRCEMVCIYNTFTCLSLGNTHYSLRWTDLLSWLHTNEGPIHH